MPSENVQVILRASEAYQRGDWASVMAEMDENIVASRVAPLPDVKTYEGHEGLMQMLSEWAEGFDDFSMSAEDCIDISDSQVVLRVHQTALGTHSGIPIEAHFWFRYTLRNRKAVRLEVYGSEQQALQAPPPSTDQALRS
jgi:ketosteroid isomerase-like protein